jgi:hypothetical protein
MAISEVVKDEKALRSFYAWAHGDEPSYIATISPFTLIELRRQPWLFQKLVATFEALPLVLLKGYDETIDEEIERYPDPTCIDISALIFTPFSGPGEQLKNLPLIHSNPTITAKEDEWNAEEQSIVDAMFELRENYPPAGANYTPQEIRTFVDIVAFQQLVERNREFVMSIHDQENAVSIAAFPAQKAMLYTVFYKFYADKNRKPMRSDAMDIIISAGLPYVEAFITEAHQAEALRKLRRVDPFLDHLDVMTLRDLRAGFAA